MINEQFLSDCTDDQIEKGVEWTRCKNLSIYEESYNNMFRNVFIIDTPKYCTKPNDIMPISFAYKIDIRHGYEIENLPTALIGDEEDYLHWVTNKNPLRAICEVYILMNINKERTI
jgi:hypothetical protein